MNSQAMTEDENRQIARDSLFVLARLRLGHAADEHRVRVRNLSAGGLMAEGRMSVIPGQSLQVEVRGIGWVEGVVAWVQDSRFGIAFRSEIDPQLARAPGGSTETLDLLVQRAGPVRVRSAPDPRSLRTI